MLIDFLLISLFGFAVMIACFEFAKAVLHAFAVAAVEVGNDKF
jgi:hypothetical protein